MRAVLRGPASFETNYRTTLEAPSIIVSSGIVWEAMKKPASFG